MSFERIPEAVQLDPGSTTLPPELDPIIAALDPPILLLVASTDDTAARAAIALAEARAAAGHATVLADVSNTDPGLHALLDVDNTEGMADVFLYGASPDHVRARPPGWSFDLVPIGAYLPDDPALFDDPRWATLARGLTGEDAAMLVLATAATPGLEALSLRIGRAVLVGDPAGFEESGDGIDPSCEVVAAVTPMAPAGAPVESGVDAPEASSTPEPLEPLVARSPAPEARDEDIEPDEPTVVRPEPEHRRAVSPILWILLIISLIVGAWFVYTEYVAPSSAPAEEAESAALPAAERGQPVETPLPISVAVEAHSELATGLERVYALRSAEPELQFFLAPVEVEGVVYYRLLAGPVTDRASADRLMERLLAGGHITAAETWAIQNTPRAFALGDYDSAALASARVDSLASQAIPAYVVEIRYEPGPSAYRVYGGAYETQGEAAAMRRMLNSAGVEAELVTRTGEPVVGS